MFKTMDIPLKYEGYDKISNQSTNGIYNKLSLILDSTFEFTRVKKMTDIKSALTFNGNILNNEKIKNEFAFQYGYYNNYATYSEEKDNTVLTKEQFSEVYNRVYNEEITIKSDYKSDIMGIYEGNRQYRFSEISSEFIDGSYKSIAKIYNSQSDCNKELKLSNSSFCANNGKELGKIEIRYTKNNTDNVINSISLYSKKG